MIVFADLCWAFVSVNLVSSMRVIEKKDAFFVALSVKDLCFLASHPLDIKVRQKWMMNMSAYVINKHT